MVLSITQSESSTPYNNVYNKCIPNLKVTIAEETYLQEIHGS